MVGGGVGVGINRGDLVLSRGHLVVLGLCKYTQLPQLQVQVLHESGDSGPDGAIIVVIQLLPLGGTGAKQGAAAQLQILPLLIHALVNEKVLLLRANLGDHVLGLRISEQAQDAQALLIQPAHGAQQGSLLIQHLAAVGAEYRGDI